MPVTEPSRAVFLSYASQDSEAAGKVCRALRVAGIEVWFDQSELRGGDAWDQSIRRQIRTCALFIPVVSKHTHERAEGYFRLEWKLAVDRSHLIMANKAFLLPVVIDETSDDDENVPDRFREVQWTRLPGGEAPAAFVERIQRLLSDESGPAADHARAPGRAIPGGAPSDRTSRGRIDPRKWVAYVAIAAIAAVALGFFALERLKGSRSGAQGAASIAILPLANESGEASQQYFSDGISEDLITALSQFPGLKVIGRTSAFQFRDSKEDSRSIGAKLGVAHLLEGSVRKSGDMIRVSAELIDTTDGSTQWSERYDRPYKDLFALQDEITRAVAGALRTKLLPGVHAAEQSERPPSASLEAYNAFLQGQFYFSRHTEADDRSAIQHYTLAVQLDPHYALAWSALSQAWTNLSSNYLEGEAAQEAHARAREASDRALALSHELAAAHVARGNLLQYADLDWRGAGAEFRRAMELAPNDGEVKFAYGNQLAVLGEVESAVDLTRQALATDPLSANWYRWLANYLMSLNRLDEAERAVRRALELQPRAEAFYMTLTMIQVQRADPHRAIEAAQQEPSGSWQACALALARQVGDDPIAAEAALKTLIQRYARSSAYQIAQVYALRHDVNKTFEWLDRAWSNRDPGIGFLLYDPLMTPYKNDPRFAAFCRKVGLPVPGETASGKST